MSLVSSMKTLHYPHSPRRRLSLLQSACVAGFSLLLGAASASAQSSRVVIESAEGYSITWDGNNGSYNNPESGAMAPDNAASFLQGTFAFASSSFLPGGVHDAINVNDGFYGNSSSWIADFTADPPDTDPYIALAFNRTVQITSVAWSRDNGDYVGRSPFADRTVGVYTLQFTQDPFPNEFTAESNNPSTGWATIGTVEYLPGPNDLFFSAYLRHSFDVTLANGSAISATAFRIKVSDVNIAIDEIEINPPADPNPPLSQLLLVSSASGYSFSWDGNEGSFAEPSDGTGVPQNVARANTTTVFASSEAGGNRLISHIHDGRYGNANAWGPVQDGSDTTPFVGFAFDEPVALNNVSWGRDNRNISTGNALGTYTVQFTQTSNPDASTMDTGDPATGWTTLGVVEYKDSGVAFQPHQRHRYQIATAGGAPIPATGLRIVLSSDDIVLDEIEINTNLAIELGLVQIQAQPGFTVVWDGNNGDFYSPAAGAAAPENEALASTDAEAFGSGELGFGIHLINKVNDGLYGNLSSWIGNAAESGFFEEFVGIRFNRTVEIESIAWSRDNGNIPEDCCGGTLTDRSIGTYTVQFTRVATPGLDTFETGDADSGWATLATIEYLGSAPPDFSTHLRHRFDVSESGSPIAATGIRIVVSDPATAIDEIEVNPPAPPTEMPIKIASLAPYSIAWDQNVGLFQNPAAGATAPANAALASQGTVAFGSSELDLDTHYIQSVNDGLYGNSSSWIADFINGDPNPFIGLRFNRVVTLQSIAWSRDNGNDTERDPPGPFTDRALGVYTLQFTQVSNPGTGTQDTGNPATGWRTLGTLTYQEGSLPHSHYLRHRFDLASDESIEATGIRILVSDPNIAIDEIEVNPIENLIVASVPGYSIRWDGRQGDFYTIDDPAPAPDNIALAIHGATAFASTELDFGVHFTPSLNDGFYGNSSSWIADFTIPDPDPFAGIIFAQPVLIENIAWGRDNGNNAGDCCGGQLMDRAIGTYTLQVTTVSNPDPFQLDSEDPATGWFTIGQVSYTANSAVFSPWLRHRYHVASNGEPIAATALRIKVSSSDIAIDEIEVNTPAGEEPASLTLSIQSTDTGLNLVWDGPSVLHTAETIEGPWVPVPGAASPHSVAPETSGEAYFLLLAP